MTDEEEINPGFMDAWNVIYRIRSKRTKKYMNSLLYPEESSPDDWIDQLCKEIEDG